MLRLLNFFSVQARDWDKPLLSQLGIPTHFLPEIVEPGTVLGELQADLAQELGFQQAEPVLIVAPGTHDTASAVAGTLGLDQNQAFISSGTWSLVGVKVNEPVLNATALQLNFTNEGGVGHTIRLLKNVMGLWLVQECQRVWQAQGQHYSWEGLVKEAEQATPFASLVDPDAPDFLNPSDMVAALQAYCQRSGQAVPATPGAIIRCCLESLAFKYRLVIEQLESLLGHPLTAIRVVGGGSQNALLCQLTAAACQREVIAGPVEATTLGNILSQLTSQLTGQMDNHLPESDSHSEVLKTSFALKSYTPASDSGEQWAEVFQRFKQIIGYPGDI